MARTEYGTDADEAQMTCDEARMYFKLIWWITDPNRKPPDLAFTAGTVRAAAQAVWDSGVLDKERQDGD